MERVRAARALRAMRRLRMRLRPSMKPVVPTGLSVCPERLSAAKPLSFARSAINVARSPSGRPCWAGEARAAGGLRIGGITKNYRGADLKSAPRQRGNISLPAVAGSRPLLRRDGCSRRDCSPYVPKPTEHIRSVRHANLTQIHYGIDRVKSYFECSRRNPSATGLRRTEAVSVWRSGAVRREGARRSSETRRAARFLSLSDQV